MAAPTLERTPKSTGLTEKPTKSANGSEAKGYCWKREGRQVTTSTLDNLGLLMEVVMPHLDSTESTDVRPAVSEFGS
jgi:hypothetical protein